MTEPKPVDVGDEGQVRKRKSAQKLAREQEIEDLKVIVASRTGRSFIWFLIKLCGIYRAASSDASEMLRGEGRRDVGLKLLAELEEVDPTAYAKIRDEGLSRDTKLKGKTNG